MAINYLNTVDLNKNQLNNAAIQNLGTDPAAGVLGQVYYNTTDSVLKICVTASTVTPTNAVWAEVGGGVETLVADNSGTTYIDLTPTTAATGAVTITGDLNAADGTPTSGRRFLTKDNTWAVPIISDQNTTYILPVSTGTAVTGYTVADIDLTAGGSGSGIASKVTFAGKNSNIAITETTGNNGIVNIALTTDVVIDDNLTLGGEISQTGAGLENIFASELNMSSQKITNVLDPTSAQDAATKQYVDTAVIGLLQFVGGFDASTGVIANTNPAEYLTDDAARVAVEVGDYYVVTVDGDFFGNAATPLTVGDSVIVQTAAVAGASVEGDFIVVQSDTDLATLTTVGIGNVNKSTTATLDGISVSYSAGTASVGLDIDGLTYITNPLTNADLASIEIPIYNNDIATAANQKIEIQDLIPILNPTISKPGSIAANALSGTVAHSFGQNTLVQTFDAGSGATVFCDVVRDTNTPYDVTATISTAQATAITILVQKIG